MFVILSHCILFSRVLIYSARCSGLFFACVYICYIYVIDNTSSPSSLLLSVQQIYTSLKLISKLHLRAPQSQSPPRLSESRTRTLVYRSLSPLSLSRRTDESGIFHSARKQPPRGLSGHAPCPTNTAQVLCAIWCQISWTQIHTLLETLSYHYMYSNKTVPEDEEEDDMFSRHPSNTSRLH